MGLANTRATREDLAGWKRFVRSFQDFFPPPFSEYFSKGPLVTEEIRRNLAELRDRLRFAWSEKDEETREWRIYEIRDLASILTSQLYDELLTCGDDFDTMPPRDGLQQAFLYLLRRPGSARVCGWEDCNQEKYFLATQPNQKYCTDVCTVAAQRKRKRGSWEHYGKAWREKRKKGKTKH